MDQIKLSYLVASYNHEKYILDCLNSIVLDGVSDSEIIIIDDGSKDSSPVLIKAWVEEHRGLQVHLVCRENRGVSATFNELVERSRGQFVRIVASDDMLLPGSSNRLIHLLESDPGKLVAMGDVRTVNEYGQVVSKSHMASLGVDPQIYENDLKRAVITKWAICGPAGLFKRDFQSTVGKYDESLVIEDWSMYLRLTAAEKVIFLPDQVALYRLHGANTSRTTDIKRRIINLSSQRSAGLQSRDLFSGGYRLLVTSQVILLSAKIAFLEKRFIRTGFLVIEFVLFRLLGQASLMFSIP